MVVHTYLCYVATWPEKLEKSEDVAILLSFIHSGLFSYDSDSGKMRLRGKEPTNKMNPFWNGNWIIKHTYVIQCVSSEKAPYRDRLTTSCQQQ